MFNAFLPPVRPGTQPPPEQGRRGGSDISLDFAPLLA
jgi:hypothetical protein